MLRTAETTGHVPPAPGNTLTPDPPQQQQVGLPPDLDAALGREIPDY
ncbi:hypothetical protein QFZ63_005551 [Streptomyces sp. B3I7]|nr:hypothetical protein [Streptomyces sp. B3I7]MDQ0813837.1 hypothetical protein [Streptomyces sp. B3I7]